MKNDVICECWICLMNHWHKELHQMQNVTFKENCVLALITSEHHELWT